MVIPPIAEAPSRLLSSAWTTRLMAIVGVLAAIVGSAALGGAFRLRWPRSAMDDESMMMATRPMMALPPQFDACGNPTGKNASRRPCWLHAPHPNPR